MGHLVTWGPDVAGPGLLAHHLRSSLALAPWVGVGGSVTGSGQLVR